MTVIGTTSTLGVKSERLKEALIDCPLDRL
jgi:hypothetical protein